MMHLVFRIFGECYNTKRSQKSKSIQHTTYNTRAAYNIQHATFNIQHRVYSTSQFVHLSISSLSFFRGDLWKMPMSKFDTQLAPLIKLDTQLAPQNKLDTHTHTFSLSLSLISLLSPLSSIVEWRGAGFLPGARSLVRTPWMNVMCYLLSSQLAAKMLNVLGISDLNLLPRLNLTFNLHPRRNSTLNLLP